MDLHSLIALVSQAAEPVMEAVQEGAHGAEAEPGVAGMFGVSWKLFIAQLVNFGIVLFVLWKWVFRPVTQALQKRTERIEQSLKDASSIDEQKLQFETWKKDEMAKARAEASGIVQAAQEESEKVRSEILAKAKLDQEQLLARTKEQLERESALAVSEVKKDIAELVVSATEAILEEKLDAKQDQGLISRALTKLQ